MKSLVDIMGMNKVVSLVKGLDGKEAVMVSSFEDNLDGAEFVGAEFRRITVSSDSESYILMPQGNQLSVQNIYALEDLKTIKEKRQGRRELRIYRFEQHAGTESEVASVIHFNPLAAFLAISKIVSAGVQDLKVVSPIKAGKFFYKRFSNAQN